MSDTRISVAENRFVELHPGGPYAILWTGEHLTSTVDYTYSVVLDPGQATQIAGALLDWANSEQANRIP